MAEISLPNSNGKFKSALAKLSQEKVDQVEKNTLIVENLTDIVKKKLGQEEVEEPEEDTSPEEQSVDASNKMKVHINSINSITQAMKTGLDKIHSSVSKINNKMSTINTLLASTATSVLQINALVSAFRADYIALNNGVDIKGDAYINKQLLKSNYLLFPDGDRLFKSVIARNRKAALFPDLMSNGVRPLLGKKLYSESDDAGGPGILSKLFGKISPDLEEYVPIIKNLAQTIGMFTGTNLAYGLNDKNVKTILESFLKDNVIKKYIKPLDDLMASWKEDDNGMPFNIKNIIGEFAEKLGFGTEGLPKLEREKNPKKVLVALAPLADDIRDLVEKEYEAIVSTPKTLVEKASYATPVWIVNSDYQKNGITDKDQKDIRKNDFIIKRFEDMLLGRTVNTKDRDGKILFNISPRTGEMQGTLLDEYIKVKKLKKSEDSNEMVNLSSLSYDTQFNHILSERSKAFSYLRDKANIDKDFNVEIEEETDPQTGEIRNKYVRKDIDRTKFNEIENKRFKNINNLLSFTNPLLGIQNAIMEMQREEMNPLDFIKETGLGSFHEIKDVFTTMFPGHQSGRKGSKFSPNNEFEGVTVHEGEIIKSAESVKLTEAAKNLNLVLAPTLAQFKAYGYLTGLKGQIKNQLRTTGKINLSKLNKFIHSNFISNEINLINNNSIKSQSLQITRETFQNVKTFFLSLNSKNITRNKEESDANKTEKITNQVEDKIEDELEKEIEDLDESQENIKEDTTDKEIEEVTEEISTAEVTDESKVESEGEVTPTEISTVEATDESKVESEGEVTPTEENETTPTETSTVEATDESKVESEGSSEESLASVPENNETTESSKAETEKSIQNIKDENLKAVEAAKQDAENAAKIREEGIKRRNDKRNQSVEENIEKKKKEKDKKTSSIAEKIKSIKEKGHKALETFKNSALGKKLSKFKEGLMEKLSIKKIGSFLRDKLKNSALIQKIVQKLTHKTAMATGEIANQEANLAIESAEEKATLITKIQGAISKATAAISEKIPVVGPAVGMGVAAAGAALIIGSGIGFLAKVIKGKDPGKSKEGKKPDVEKEKKKHKKGKGKNKENKNENSQAIPNSTKNKIDEASSSSNNEDSIVGQLNNRETKLMTKVMNSEFGRGMMKDPSKSAAFMFNLQSGDKIGFKNAKHGMLSKLAKKGAQVGGSFTTAMLGLIKKLKNKKKKKSTDLASKNNNLSENADLAFSQASIAKTQSNAINAILKNMDMDVIEDENGGAISTSKIMSNALIKDTFGDNAMTDDSFSSDSSSSPSSNSSSSSNGNGAKKSKITEYINKYDNLSNLYKDYLKSTKGKKHHSFKQWIPAYYKQLEKEYGKSTGSNSSKKNLARNLKEDFYKDLTNTSEWYKLPFEDKEETINILKGYGLDWNTYATLFNSGSCSSTHPTFSCSSSGKGRNGLGLYNGLGNISSNYLDREFLNASSFALKNNYKEKNGGTYPSFFNNYLKKSGINISNNLSDEQIKQNLINGKPVILMGSDINNNGKTPFGKDPHYVVATGYDGKNIYIEDSEEKTSTVYNANNVLNNSSIKLGTDNENYSNNISKRKMFKSSAKKGKGNKHKIINRRKKYNGNKIANLPTRIRQSNSLSVKDSKIKGRKNVKRYTGKGKYGNGKYGRGGWNDRIEAKPELIRAAQKGWEEYGILASVTIAQAIGESGWGSAGHGPKHNNWFGHSLGFSSEKYRSGSYTTSSQAGQPSEWAAYKTPEDCFLDHAYVLSGGSGNNRYKGAVGETDPYKALKAIADGGYCSPPDQYAETMYGYIKENDLTQYDDGSFTGSSSEEDFGDGEFTGEVKGEVEMSIRTYVDIDELQKYVTYKGQYTRAYENELAKYQDSEGNENDKNKEDDESIDISSALASNGNNDDNEDTSSAIANENSSNTPSTSNPSNFDTNEKNNNVNNITNINNIINNMNGIVSSDMGTTYIKNEIKAIDPDNMKDILAYFKELNEIQDNSLDVIEVIYDKLRKKKGKPKKNFKSEPDLIGIHGRKYGI